MDIANNQEETDMTDERLIPHTRAAGRKGEELMAAAERLWEAGLDPKSDMVDSSHEAAMDLLGDAVLKDLNRVIDAIEAATSYDGYDLLDAAKWAADRAAEVAIAQRSPEGARQRAERARAAADGLTELLGYAIEGADAADADLPIEATLKVNSDISTQRHAAVRWDKLAEEAEEANPTEEGLPCRCGAKGPHAYNGTTCVQ